MAKQKNETITVQGVAVSIAQKEKNDYISLTDMAKFKNPQATGVIISKWLST